MLRKRLAREGYISEPHGTPPTTPPLPADYYQRHTARVRKLASEATTVAIKNI
jgi:hypothetical protein